MRILPDSMCVCSLPFFSFTFHFLVGKIEDQHERVLWQHIYVYTNHQLGISQRNQLQFSGCKLIVIIQEGDEIILRRSIFPEKGLMCTFEITLVLHLKKRICQHFKLFDKNSSESFTVLEQYELRKEKLYTSKHRKLQRTQSSSPGYPRWNPKT